MKKKTLEKVIRLKIEDWLKSIDAEPVREIARKNIIVTGGCIASGLLGEKINDFDVYFKTKEAVIVVAEYYARKLEAENKNLYVVDGAEVKNWVETGKNAPKFVDGRRRYIRSLIEEGKEIGDDGEDLMSPFSDKELEDIENRKKSLPWWAHPKCLPEDRVKLIVYGKYFVDDGTKDEEFFKTETEGSVDAEDIGIDEAVEEGKEKYRVVFVSTNAITLSNKIQIITRFYGDAAQIHKNFDYVHCTCYYDYEHRDLVTPEEALLAMMSKTLVYKGSLYPITSVIRSRKFINRGWTINAGQYLKMAMQISQLDLKDLAVLEDQLVGVDSAFFADIIGNLIERQRKGENYGLEYVAEIIDKVFG